MPMSPRLLRPRAASGDSDVLRYVAAVEAADGQALEQSVKDAIRDFILGCKTDNTWSAIKASCILMGARTLSGALTPLVGAAPTNNNFVGGDYSRKTGLVGNGSTKFLNSGRANNADGQNDKHAALWITAQHSLANAFACQVGAGSNGAGAINLATTGRPQIRFHTSTLSDPISNTALQNGLYAASREASGSYTSRQNGSNATISVASETPTSDNLFIFCRNNGSGTGEQFTNARIAFYSIGTSLTLSSLDSRVGALVTAIGAAI